MPSYAELADEPWWNDEYEPPPLARFNEALRRTYNLTQIQCGSKGDNRHLRGRHRSRNWALNSQYCTNRAYGTTDARDKRGPGDALRATDLGLVGPPLWAVCRRVDQAVRAGKLTGLAEWFGTFDGKTVVGWSNGRPATSDNSHLTHGHFGYWTEATTDQTFFDELFAVMTGDDDMATPEQIKDEVWYTDLDKGTRSLSAGSALLRAYDSTVKLETAVAALDAKVTALGAGGIDIAALAEALAPHMEAAAERAVRTVLGAVDGATPQ